ncbi:hypothetical protein, partial [Acinetobacter nosocomialis]
VDGLGFSFNLLSENGSILAKSSFYTDSELRDLKIDETIKISETDIIIDPPNNDETYALSS